MASRVTERGMSLYIKDLSCELCNSSLPSLIKCENQQISLITLSFPLKSYVILEEFRPEKLQKQGLHVVSLEEGQNASIGRGNDCDIKVSDISVSRKHSKIKLCNSGFYIEDMKSKFGTLVKLGSDLLIKNNTDITIQVNRTVLNLVYKQRWGCGRLCCCLSSNKVSGENCSHITQTELQLNHFEQNSNRNTLNLPIDHSEFHMP